MKQNQIKSFVTIILGCILMLALPFSSLAQKKHVPKKNKKTKIVTPVKHYKSMPHRGGQVVTIPQQSVVVKHKQINYHFNKGVFYKPVKGSYVVVSPPIGIKVDFLPPKPFVLSHRGQVYQYYYGTYYKQIPNGDYEVVDAPIGARIDALPEGYEIFELDGFVYYKLDATYYKAVVESNGLITYEVVKV